MMKGRGVDGLKTALKQMDEHRLRENRKSVTEWE